MNLKNLIQVIAAGPICMYSVAANAQQDFQGINDLMQYLDARMMEVNRSLIQNDLDGIQAAARAIDGHPTLPMGERISVLSQLGSDAGAFRAHDARMQEAARDLADAALQNDRERIKRHHWELVDRCAACHREFGNRLGNHENGEGTEHVD